MKTKMKTRIAAAIAAAAIATSNAVMPASATYNKSTLMAYVTFKTSYQQSFVRTEKKKFPEGKYWNSGDPNKVTNQPCSYNNHHDTHVKHYNVYQENTNGTISRLGTEDGCQCFGFAYKLASDFFGGLTDSKNAANVWIRLQYKPGMQLRVGDHIRLKGYNHSVFVTEVNGNSLKVADCNAAETCLIRWDLDSSVDSVQGVFYMRDACNVRTACVADWIERPVMAGDVNLDSEFNAADIQIILKIAKGTYNFNGKQRNVMMEAADLNNDGKVTLDDWNMAWDEWNYNTTIPGTCGKQRFLTNVGNWN